MRLIHYLYYPLLSPRGRRKGKKGEREREVLSCREEGRKKRGKGLPFNDLALAVNPGSLASKKRESDKRKGERKKGKRKKKRWLCGPSRRNKGEGEKRKKKKKEKGKKIASGLLFIRPAGGVTGEREKRKKEERKEREPVLVLSLTPWGREGGEEKKEEEKKGKGNPVSENLLVALTIRARHYTKEKKGEKRK